MPPDGRVRMEETSSGVPDVPFSAFKFPPHENTASSERESEQRTDRPNAAIRPLTPGHVTKLRNRAQTPLTHLQMEVHDGKTVDDFVSQSSAQAPGQSGNHGAGKGHSRAMTADEVPTHVLYESGLYQVGLTDHTARLPSDQGVNSPAGAVGAASGASSGRDEEIPSELDGSGRGLMRTDNAASNQTFGILDMPRLRLNTATGSPNRLRRTSRADSHPRDYGARKRATSGHHAHTSKMESPRTTVLPHPRYGMPKVLANNQDDSIGSVMSSKGKYVVLDADTNDSTIRQSRQGLPPLKQTNSPIYEKSSSHSDIACASSTMIVHEDHISPPAPMTNDAAHAKPTQRENRQDHAGKEEHAENFGVEVRLEHSSIASRRERVSKDGSLSFVREWQQRSLDGRRARAGDDMRSAHTKYDFTTPRLQSMNSEGPAPVNERAPDAYDGSLESCLALAKAFAFSMEIEVADSLKERLTACVAAQFRNDTISNLHEAAVRDPEIGISKHRENISSLTKVYRNDLREEFHSENEKDIFHLIRIVRREVNRSNHESDSCGSLNAPVEILNDSAPSSEEDFLIVQNLLLNSNAYVAYKEALFDMIHRPYRRRLLNSLGDEVLGATGRKLTKGSLQATAYELSFVPSSSAILKDNHDITFPDMCKAWIENTMGETWNWWPMKQRHFALPEGWRRLEWRSPTGDVDHISLPSKAAEATIALMESNRLLTHLESQPAEIPSSARLTTKPSSSTVASNTRPASRSPMGSGDQTTPSLQFAPHLYRTTGISDQVQATRDLQGGTIPNQIQPPEPQHVFLCVHKGSAYSFGDISASDMHSDAAFFHTLKKQYVQLRGWLRHYFSMWQYDHCDFFEFYKYPLGDQDEGAPRRIGFPSKTDTDYDFVPRPIEPCPPGGPISEQEFRRRFHDSSDQCHSWHLWHRQKLSRRVYSQGAVARLPKRKNPLDMSNGKREVFWGIYARERRSFARVLACGFAANVPGIVFFFLWLFRWNHASDLQNAAVPVGMSLSLTMLFVALLFESREVELK